MSLLKNDSGRPVLVESSPTAPPVHVRLFTAHSVLSGLLRLAYNRLSDQLNFGPAVIALDQAELVRQDYPAVHRSRHGASIQRDAILMAIDRTSEDYTATHPALYQEKTQHQVTVDLGHFVVDGTLHLRHGRRGLAMAEWVGDTPRFVPLTDVTIYGWGAEPINEKLAIISRATLTALLY